MAWRVALAALALAGATAADARHSSTALDPRHAHFPGIAERLTIDQAGQSACARFHRLGFDAAALVTIGFGLGIDDIELRTVKLIEMLLDRPFGFLAVHRPTGLVLFAGWVTNPADAEP